MIVFEDEEPDDWYNPNLDGITHINTYSKGRTVLGRMLSNFYASKFTHPKYGTFESVEGFWYWYSTGQKYDILRELSGYNAKKEGTKYDRVEEDPKFHDIVLECIALKVLNNKEIHDELKESTLPFTHYYMYGTLENHKVHRVQCKWMMDGLEKIRQIIKEAK